MNARAKRIAKKIKEPLVVKDPSLLDAAEAEMAKLVWVPIEDDFPPMKMAFATKTNDNCYKVFVNNKIPERYRNQFKLHEYGHILFGHLLDLDENNQQLKHKFTQFWPKIKKHIELEPEDENKDILDIFQKYLLPVQNLFENYAMDMEVNSKLFTNAAERKQMREITSIALVLAILNDDSTSDSVLDQIEDHIKNKPDEPHAKPIYPEDYGFPDKKSFTEYLDLMFLNLDKFMDLLKQQAKDLDLGPSNGNSGNNGDGDGGSGSKLSLEEIEALRKAANASDTDKEENNKIAEKAGHGEGADDFSDGDSESEDSDPADGEGAGSGWTGNRGFGAVGHGHKEEVIELGNGKSLAKYLEKEVFSKHVSNTRVNEMYYYNRRKYGDKDVVAKLTKEELYRPGNLILVIDCSGSIDKKAIRIMISVIRQLSKKCGPRSRVIWWDTRLCGDTFLRQEQEPCSGGCTDIAGGIKYAAEHYLKHSNDKLVVISDYCDTLSRWLEEAEKFKNDIIGIGWTYQASGSVSEFIRSNYWTGSVDADKFMKRIRTKIVRIDNR